MMRSVSHFFVLITTKQLHLGISKTVGDNTISKFVRSFSCQQHRLRDIGLFSGAVAVQFIQFVLMKLFRELRLLRLVILVAVCLFFSVNLPSGFAAIQKPANPKAKNKSASVKPATAATEQQKASDKQATTDAKPQTETGDDAEYTCPMHPDVRSKTKGKCPKCAMTLVSINPAFVDDFGLKMEATPAAPKPNEKVKLHFAIFNPKTGEQVKEFTPTHEKLFHLFVISQDLTQFQHIHPVFNNGGTFTIETVLPKAGHYKIYCDFYPVDGAPQVLQQSITTAGYRDDLFASQAKLTPETTLTKTFAGAKITRENADNIGVTLASLKQANVGDLKVELKVEPEQIIAGRPATLKYHLTDAKTGAAVRDLSPYLGAWGHTLILSEDQTDYVHSHPSELPPDPFDTTVTDESKFLGGPDVTFEALFPREGNYRIWTQFLRGDVMTTVTFTVRAERLH
jgi:Heavy metal binding domain